MFNILIADDEPIFREHLKHILSKRKELYNICAECSSGDETLATFKRLEPDIALLDINMPEIDGITLAGEIHSLYPTTQIIIVTAQSKFEYAHQAVKLGICDYILKPFNLDELYSAIDNAILNIRNLRKEILLKSSGELHYQISNSETIEHSDYLNGFLQSDFRSGVRLIIFQLFSSKYTDLFLLAATYFPLGALNYVSVDLQNNSIILIDKGFDIASIVTLFYNEQLQVELGISQKCKSAEQLCQAYHDAKLDLRKKLHDFAQQNKPLNEAHTFYTPQDASMLERAIVTGDTQIISSLLDKIFDKLIPAGTNELFVSTVSFGLLSVCLSSINSTHEFTDEFLKNSFFPLEDLVAQNEIEDIKKWLANCFMQASNFINSTRASKSVNIPKAVEEYVQKEIANPELSIDYIARKMFFNASYLRNLFKAATGIPLNQYIINSRMELAKQLLYRSNLKQSEVAAKVGYDDISYFSKSFKKYTGVSPKIFQSE